MKPPIPVILNAHSGAGNGDATREKLQALFREHAREVRISVAAEGELKPLAEEVAQGGSDLVVVGGGDGTISCVAAALIGTDKTLGVLPLGTLNHFSKDLGIPQELEAAVRTIVTGETIQVDVAEVNGRFFLNNSSLGMYPLVVSDRLVQQHRFRRRKWPAFFLAVVHTLRRYPLVQVRISTAEQTLSRRTPSVFVGNNPYTFTGLNLGKRATLQDGKLGLCITRDVGRWGVFKLLLRAVARRLHPETDFDTFNVSEATIETHHRRLLVATDGEISSMTSPLHYRTHPGALRVWVPRPAAGP